MNWKNPQPFQQLQFHQLEHLLHTLPSDTLPNSFLSHSVTLYNILLTRLMRAQTQETEHQITVNKKETETHHEKWLSQTTL